MPGSTDLIYKVIMKSLKFIVNISESVIDYLVKERDLFMGAKPLRTESTIQDQREETERTQVVTLLGNKISGMIKIALSWLNVLTSVGVST